MPGWRARGVIGSFAIDFALDEDGHAAAIGASAQPEEHAHATLLALRANAFRAGTVFGVAADWREAVAALRATGSAWNPLARAGVVLYGLETLAETGELSVVALGNARTESEQCYEAALTALGAVQAATTLGGPRSRRRTAAGDPSRARRRAWSPPSRAHGCCRRACRASARSRSARRSTSSV